MSILKIFLISLISIPIAVVFGIVMFSLSSSSAGLAASVWLLLIPLEILFFFCLVFLILMVINKRISKLYLILYILAVSIIFFFLFMGSSFR